MNILITGCNGQLGNEMQLLEDKYPQHRFYNTDVNELDITNQLAVADFINRNAIDGIVNCAAYTAVDKAESDQKLCTALNTEAGIPRHGNREAWRMADTDIYRLCV